MSKTYSTTIETSNTNGEIEKSFTFIRGVVTINIADEMLTTEGAIQERAEAIFLEQSYTHEQVTFTTPYQDGLMIGSVISYDTVLYKVVDITYTIKGAVTSMSITGKRWNV